jgi:hypothetical protein
VALAAVPPEMHERHTWHQWFAKGFIDLEARHLGEAPPHALARHHEVKVEFDQQLEEPPVSWFVHLGKGIVEQQQPWARCAEAALD